ncbi:hypothetical protein ILUMI_05879 [Ignelater luminosus]|uniref:Uncharacterized protein n=1 Tax=Ignelater luminosus TaxID=2038154 RepID=A0A8K0DBF7_IGNLU|nr:hypothetical protein ILUMI_05879 [Ignelater luminosus]
METTEHFRIESISMCEEVPNQLVKFYLTPKDYTAGTQTVDINMTSPKSIGENTRLNCMGYLGVRERWVYLFTYEDDFCFVLRAYVGQLFYDMERAAGILPGSCPISQGQNAENFVVESCKFCENITNPTIKVYVTFKDFIPGHQTIEANLSTPITIDESTVLKTSVDIEAKLKRSRWVHLFTVEDDFCRVIQMYIGEFWYEIQRAAAVAPRTCPIPRGNYHVVNHKLNFEKLKLQTFPFGRLRVTMITRDKYTKNVLSCLVCIIANYLP